LYAGFNNIPTIKDGKVYGYDVMGCNVQTCKTVSSINTKISTPVKLNLNEKTAENGTWFIAVQAVADNVDYLIWINSVCPGNCTDRGNCQEGDNYGLCKCSDGYEGLSCANSQKVMEVLILIIIGALVALSAILGLVAWAYMRNKKPEYEAIKQ